MGLPFQAFLQAYLTTRMYAVKVKTDVATTPWGAALELRTDTASRLHHHHLTGATIFRPSSQGELNMLEIIVDAINDTHQQP